MRALFYLFTLVFTIALMSVIFDLTPTGADKACLVLLATSVLSALIGSTLYSKYDKTNGNDSGLIAATLVIMGDTAICVITPLLILFGLLPFVVTTIVAAALIVGWTGLLTYGLID